MPLIVFEGIDGCGKTTQMDLLRQRLDQERIAHAFFRDPGGTELGESVRSILLEPGRDVGRIAELFGYLLSRAQLVHEELAPRLAAGELIVLDRFWPSTFAYQAVGLDMDRQQVRAAIDLCSQDIRWDCCCYFRLDAAEAARRRSLSRGEEDRIEARGLAYLRRVEQGYEALVEEGLVTPVDASQSVDAIAETVWETVGPIIAR
jgi:dTMP kinase